MRAINPNVTQLAKFVLSEMMDDLAEIKLIDVGATSAAYRLTGQLADYVLRIPATHNQNSANYDVDYWIRKQLTDLTHFVAKPLLTSQMVKHQRFGDWILDEFCEGSSVARGQLADNVGEQLGIFLRALHSLPISGFGDLEVDGLSLTGNQKSAELGLLARFESPWPFSRESIAEHPCALSEAALVEKLLQLEGDLRDFASSGRASIVHTDLHEKQLLVKGNGLSAVLDLNDAVGLRPEWDLGSVLYFHGRQCLHNVLVGYAREEQWPLLEKDSFFAAILIALHHGNRGQKLNKPHRIIDATRFLVRELT